VRSVYMKRSDFKIWILLLSSISIIQSCTSEKPSNLSAIEETILKDKTSFYYLDTKNYPVHNKSLPIGIFDSGTGGLTVLDAIVNFDGFNNENHQEQIKGDGLRDFQSEYFIYLGDQANMPYGNYSRENKVNLLKEHIIKDVQFLLDNKYYLSGDDRAPLNDKKRIKAIVIACNTATAFGKSNIESFLATAGLDIKVIGVIDAAVRAAFENSKSNADGSIGIMATAGTVSSNGYVNAIRQTLSNNDMPDIYQQAGIGLAAAIDGNTDFISSNANQPVKVYRGPSISHPEASIDTTILNRYGFNWDDNKMLFKGEPSQPQDVQINSVTNYISYHLVSLLEQIRKSEKTKPLNSIILGCTHYPFYTDVIQNKLNTLYNYQENGQYIYRPVMAEKIKIIDPAKNTARELYDYLNKKKMFNSAYLSQCEFYISVPNLLNRNVVYDSLGNFPYDYKYGRTAGNIQQYVKRVPFSEQTIAKQVMTRLDTSIPFTSELIRNFMETNPKTVLQRKNSN